MSGDFVFDSQSKCMMQFFRYDFNLWVTKITMRNEAIPCTVSGVSGT